MPLLDITTNTTIDNQQQIAELASALATMLTVITVISLIVFNRVSKEEDLSL